MDLHYCRWRRSVRAKSDGEEPGLALGVFSGGGHVNVVCEK